MLQAIPRPAPPYTTTSRAATEPAGTARQVYFDLLDDGGTSGQNAASRTFLEAQLDATRALTADLPADMRAIAAWIDHNNEQVGHQYRAYLAERHAGAPRRYFTAKSHALHFLKSVAPTKLVDGAWLYGLLPHWRDARFTPLIRIYLEELGEGVPDKNHVLLYKQLLAAHDCGQWQDLDDNHFIQGAIQLSLAAHAGDFLPEVIGFNLGYEQLPLHLLIAAYELNELGIDPYYFTLHVTVDNADTGHAKKSLQGLQDALPRAGDANAFYQRVIDGYKLNMLGAGTTSVIAAFDLDEELISVFRKKSAVGKFAHSDYCRVAQRTVSDWLADPAQIPAFLDALVNAGWIRRNEDPKNSRFWKLIQGDRAEMFGVFSAYEQQLLHDWIAGPAGYPGSGQTPRTLSYKARQRLHDTLGGQAYDRPPGDAARGIFRRHYGSGASGGQDDFSSELRVLEETLSSLPGKQEAMTMLVQLMSPARHHTSAGLMATRIFTSLLP
jgi:hypothetical protein